MDSMQDIADYGRDIQSALRQLSEALSNTTSPDESLTIFVERTQQSFLLWAANLGMFDQGHRSLSYRLQDAQDVKEYMAELLEELLYNLNELILLCTDELSPDPIDSVVEDNHDVQSFSSIDHDDEPEDGGEEASRSEILGHVESANDIQHRLFGLAHKIRHPLMRSAPGKRNVYRTIDSAERSMAIKQLVEVENGRISDYFLQIRRDLQNLPDAQALELDFKDKMLIGRLAQANSFRRQQFVFWRETNRERYEIAGQQLFQPMPLESAARPVDHINVLSLPTRTNPTPTAQPSMPSSVTKLQPGQLDLADRFSVATHDTRAPSAYGPTGEQVGWPGPPSELKPEATGYVACPYCHNLCPNRYLEKGAWKNHLLHDLRPYSCTYPECTTKENMYESYSTWSAHEFLEHNGAFKCLEHEFPTSGPPEFIELSAYQDHVKQDHPEQASEMLRYEAVIARRGGSSSANRPCPVCLTQILDSRAMMKHVAGHLEIIALMTLPPSTGLEAGSEGGSARPGMQSAFGTNSRADLDDLSLPGEEDVPRAAHVSNQALTDTHLYKEAEDSTRSFQSAVSQLSQEALSAARTRRHQYSNIDEVALLESAKVGDLEVVSLLLNDDASVDAKDDDGSTALIFTAKRGYEKVVQLLLDRGASVEAKDNKGWTALIYAAIEGHEKIVQLLLNRGASVEAKDNKGWTALICAADSGHEKVVQLLLDRGASVDIKDNNGWTALIYTADSGHEKVIQLLLDRGASVDTKDDDGSTALMRAAKYGHKKAVQLLLDRGASVDIKDNDGWTALMYAANRGHEKVVQLLLDRGASVDIKDNISSTAAIWAARYGHEKVVQLLLDRGASVDVKDNTGSTALIWAAEQGHEKVVQLLLDRGAGIDAKNKDGKSNDIGQR